jgi:YfiH family protein
MIEKKMDLLRMFFFENLSKYKEIRHFLSTRVGGFSDPPYSSLNLGFHVGDDPEDVLENRKRLATAIGIPLNRFTLARQVHSGNVTIISEQLRGKGCANHKEAINATDSMVTNVRDICLLILTADCVPMLFFDPSRKAIGVAHAGWQGTLKFVALNTVRTMEKAFGSSPRNIVVGIGPSIGPCCYEVGPEVIYQVEKVFQNKKEYMVNESADGSGYFDLWKANLKQLLHAGVKRTNIEMARICTCHNPDLFFSYRHQKGDTGRFGVGITLC